MNKHSSQPKERSASLELFVLGLLTALIVVLAMPLVLPAANASAPIEALNPQSR